jgi:PhoPQ-activated pathogenicity-related protein
VIDTLNFPVQTQHQLDVWGKFSEQIDDYTRKGLVRTDDSQMTPREEALWKMMDPYTYRGELTLPKLIINGTNDRYWVVDALKNYWDDLEGPKFIHLVPNAGHSLDGGRENALRTLGVFFRFNAVGQPLPELKWDHTNGNGEHRLTIRSNVKPAAARIWSATSPDRDFRESRWESAAMTPNGDHFEATLDDPAPAHLALYGELQFDASGIPYSLTTRVFQESGEAAGN